MDRLPATAMPIPAFVPVLSGEGELRSVGDALMEVDVGDDVLGEMGRGDEGEVVGKLIDELLVVLVSW